MNKYETLWNNLKEYLEGIGSSGIISNYDGLSLNDGIWRTQIAKEILYKMKTMEDEHNTQYNEFIITNR